MVTREIQMNGIKRRERVAARELAVLQLREMQGMRFKEIARAMNLGTDMTRTIYGRACRKRRMGKGQRPVTEDQLSVKSYQLIGTGMKPETGKRKLETGNLKLET